MSKPIRMPLPCYVSGVRQKIDGLGDCVVIHGADGRDGIKADTWYVLRGGKPVEVTQ